MDRVVVLEMNAPQSARLHLSCMSYGTLHRTVVLEPGITQILDQVDVLWHSSKRGH